MGSRSSPNSIVLLRVDDRLDLVQLERLVLVLDTLPLVGLLVEFQPSTMHIEHLLAFDRANFAEFTCTFYVVGEFSEKNVEASAVNIEELAFLFRHCRNPAEDCQRNVANPRALFRITRNVEYIVLTEFLRDKDAILRFREMHDFLPVELELETFVLTKYCILVSSLRIRELDTGQTACLFALTEIHGISVHVCQWVYVLITAVSSQLTLFTHRWDDTISRWYVTQTNHRFRCNRSRSNRCAGRTYLLWYSGYLLPCSTIREQTICWTCTQVLRQTRLHTRKE